jgi:uncharacterized protein (DUF1697 family)
MELRKIIADSGSLPPLRTFGRSKRAKGIYHRYPPTFAPAGACAVSSTWLGTSPVFPYTPGMALIVFLRGVNVGGHRTFRPSLLARELGHYDVVNVGAAGTFIVRKPPSRAKLRAELRRKLPFDAEVVLCDGRDLIRLERENPFATEPPSPDIVRFVSILSKTGGVRALLPVTFPSHGEWLVKVMASEGQFVFGIYRRHMKTIGYLGRIDELYGVPATTRNWNTITAIVRILKGSG